MLLYDYGSLAWVWRVLIVFVLMLGSVFVVMVLRTGELLALLGALALLAPAAFFGHIVAVRASRQDDGRLEIRTLLFGRRRIAPDRLGVPRVRKRYRSIHGDLSAPRMWVPVKGEWPIYFDLLGKIPDRQAFLTTMRVRADELRRAD